MKSARMYGTGFEGTALRWGMAVLPAVVQTFLPPRSWMPLAVESFRTSTLSPASK